MIRARFPAPQPLEMQWEIGSTPTKTAPGLSGWLSRDPMEERGSLNFYGYVGNSPIERSDPLGLLALSMPAGTDENLFLMLAQHWLVGMGRLFTSGADVVSRQSLVRDTVRIHLLETFIGRCKRLRGYGLATVGEVRSHHAHLRGVLANDSPAMLHSLNGATDFTVDGTIKGVATDQTDQAGGCGCRMAYDLSYHFLDLADLHAYLFPDIIPGRLIQVGSLGLVGHTFSVDIGWQSRGTIEKTAGVGVIGLGWPFDDNYGVFPHHPQADWWE